MKECSPGKTFIKAPTFGKGATCKSCGKCPWMKMNSLENLFHCLEKESNEIKIDYSLINLAKIPLQRMLEFNSIESVV